ncbi:uncharacterized protein LOC133891730 [Phragmites australis]|uniref:uncharacterized protein LOC133891730 n=1 Tax=Phragmites australis TaxID=29695 RepID=UPI002D790EA5|nr:uncharacterized protein LOC133891730 [Phragmites australis]
MACGLLQPAGSDTAAAALWPCLLLPAPRRSFPTKEQPHRVPCMNQFHRKLPLSGNAVSAAQPHRSRSLVCCTSLGSSALVAALSSRPANVSTSHSDLSMRRCMDSVPGALIVISGYWAGPDVDDGGGSVEALLQRIV